MGEGTGLILSGSPPAWGKAMRRARRDAARLGSPVRNSESFFPGTGERLQVPPTSRRPQDPHWGSPASLLRPGPASPCYHGGTSNVRAGVGSKSEKLTFPLLKMLFGTQTCQTREERDRWGSGTQRPFPRARHPAASGRAPGRR